LKHRVFKNENLPIRVDLFLEKLIPYYRGDNVLLQHSISNEYDSTLEEPKERDDRADNIDEIVCNIDDINDTNNTKIDINRTVEKSD